MPPTIHIAHLVNPVAFPPSHELFYAQPITFESMRIAREGAGQDVQIELLSAQFGEDHDIIPGFFHKTPDLQRSAADCAQFTTLRKLPLLADLLERLYTCSTAEYLIYTNVDIALQPHFYREVAVQIRSGLEAFIINRRRLPATFRSIDDLPAMYRHPGAAHPGFDCFVFHRSLYPRFQLEQVCIGIPFIEILFSQNLFCFAKRFALFDKEFLTFHIGMEIFKKRDPEYLRFNRTQYRKAIGKLWPYLDNRKFPWGNKNLFYRFIRWGLHPAIPIALALKLESRRWRKG